MPVAAAAQCVRRAPLCSCRRYHLGAGAVEQRAIWQKAVVAVVCDQMAGIAHPPLHNAALQGQHLECYVHDAEGTTQGCACRCTTNAHRDHPLMLLAILMDAKQMTPSVLSMAASRYLDVGVAADVDAIIAHVRPIQVHVTPPTPVQTLQHEHPCRPT